MSYRGFGLGFDLLVNPDVMIWEGQVDQVRGLANEQAAPMVPLAVVREITALGFTNVEAGWGTGGKVWFRYTLPHDQWETEIGRLERTSDLYRRERLKVALTAAARSLGPSVRFILSGGSLVLPPAAGTPTPGTPTPGTPGSEGKEAAVVTGPDTGLILGLSGAALGGIALLSVAAYFAFRSPVRRNPGKKRTSKKQKKVRRWPAIKAKTEFKVWEAVGLVRDVHPKATHVPPGVMQGIRVRGPGLYVYGFGKKGASLRKYKAATDLTGALAAARIAARVSDEPHWVIDFHGDYPVVVRQLDPGGKTAYRVEEYAKALVKEPVYVYAVKKKATAA